MSKRLMVMAALLVTCLGSMTAFAGSSAAAQDDTATYDLQISTSQCEENPCGPDNAEFIGDVTVLVTSADGSIDYGSCTTTIDAIPGGCSVFVDPETTVEVTVDESTIPDGYVALDYPIVYDVPAEKDSVGDVALYFSPQEDTVDDGSAADDEAATDDEAAADDEVPVDDEEAAADEDVDASAGDATAAASLPNTGTGSDDASGGANETMMLVGALGVLGLVVAGGFFVVRRSAQSIR